MLRLQGKFVFAIQINEEFELAAKMKITLISLKHIYSLNSMCTKYFAARPNYLERT